MTPLRLTARNYASFPSLDFRFEDGVVAIVGPNGVGKSTLLNGVELALFADGARDLAPALGPFDEKLEIALEFEHDGETYRVRRSYDGSGRGKTTLDFEQHRTCGVDLDDIRGPWDSLNREKTSETQAAIEATLGLNRATFNASAFLAQGNSAAFTDATPAERKSILGAILDARGLWPTLAERAATDRKTADLELSLAQARIAEREPLAAQVPELHRAADRAAIEQEQARENHRQAEERLEAAQKAEAANQAAEVMLTAAQQAHRSATSEVLKARDVFRLCEAQAAEVSNIQAAVATLEQRAAEIPELERRAEEQRTVSLRADSATREKAEAEEGIRRQRNHIVDLHVESEEIARRYQAAKAQLAHLLAAENGVERCDRCQQILGDEARAAAVESLKAENVRLADDLQAKLAAHQEAQRLLAGLEESFAALKVPVPFFAADFGALLKSARQAAQERAGLLVRLEGYSAAATELPARTAALTASEDALAAAALALEQARDATADPEALAEKTGRGRRDLANRRVDLEEAAAELARAQAVEANARTAADELRTLGAKTADLLTRLATLRLAERALGRDGVPALIAENACAAIEAEANRVLERLPTEAGTVFRVELRTQRALKSSETLKETLDILIADRQTAREFATFSGGERFRVSFALRWALARLLAGRRGAESRLLVVDEPDGLDAAGMDGLAALLRAEADIFSRVLIVSHNPLLASAFERVVRVTSDGEVSRLEDAA